MSVAARSAASLVRASLSASPATHLPEAAGRPPERPGEPLLRPFRIGPYLLANNLILAPMAGVSDRPFRALCRRFGAGLAVGEMVASDASLRGSPKTVRRLDFAGEPGPVAVQIVGTDPAAMAEAARVNVGLGADILDINMGCPAKKVCRAAAGSALLKDEALIGRILCAVVEAVPVPVTLKIRTGWSPETRNAPSVARIARECGIAALAVHGRTRGCGYDTPAEHATARAIAETVDIPLIANGDIDSPEAARRVLDSTRAGAIMLGRAAQGRPWIFRAVARYLATGAVPPEPSAGPIGQLLIEHLDGLYGFYGARAGVRIARKHIAWYCRGLPGAAQFRERINRAETPADQISQVRAYFAQTATAIPDVSPQSPTREEHAA